MFEPLDLGNGRIEVRTENGIAHLSQDSDGKWTIAEDKTGAKFVDRGSAFDRVRKLMRVKD